MSEPATDGLRERLAEAVRGIADSWQWKDGIYEEEIADAADALLPVVEQHVAEQAEADRDRYAAELAEARRDADLGWADAEKRQKESQEWAATWKRLNDYNTLLLAALARGTWPPEGQALVCGAVGITASGHLGPCTGGWHHESFPHQDGNGARWQVLVLPADAEPDDLTARLAAAYHTRFDNDGHPEDSTTAAEVAMTVLGPERDRLQADRDRYRSAWQSARERAQARGEGIERLCNDRDSWKGWLRTAEAEVRRLTELVGQYADRGIANGQRAEAAEKRIEALTEATILWRDRPGGDVGLAIALASILDIEKPEPPAATALVRVLRECDRIERDVYGQHDEDDDGMREAVRRVRAAAGPVREDRGDTEA